jgi:hypothetical protein
MFFPLAEPARPLRSIVQDVPEGSPLSRKLTGTVGDPGQVSTNPTVWFTIAFR